MADARLQLNCRLEPEEMQLVDELRRREPDLPNRSEMTRRLYLRAAVAEGLISEKDARAMGGKVKLAPPETKASGS